MTLTVTFNEAVTVAGGTPTLALNDGGIATYVSGSGSNALVFSYTVAAGQNTADLALAASTAIALNGATIRDAAGNNAVLTAANGYNPVGMLQINTVAPAVSAVATSPANGNLTTGATVTLTVTFSAAVTVAGGTPTIALNDGGTANYVSGSGSNALVFSYTVAAGQNAADLALAAKRDRSERRHDPRRRRQQRRADRRERLQPRRHAADRHRRANDRRDRHVTWIRAGDSRECCDTDGDVQRGGDSGRRHADHRAERRRHREVCLGLQQQGIGVQLYRRRRPEHR